MTAKTNAERQAALKRRRQEAGLKQVTQLWLHPDDHAAIKAKAASLRRSRERQSKETP